MKRNKEAKKVEYLLCGVVQRGCSEQTWCSGITPKLHQPRKQIQVSWQRGRKWKAIENRRRFDIVWRDEFPSTSTKVATIPSSKKEGSLAFLISRLLHWRAETRRDGEEIWPNRSTFFFVNSWEYIHNRFALNSKLLHHIFPFHE